MLKCTKNDSVRGSVSALGKGAPGLYRAMKYVMLFLMIFDPSPPVTNSQILPPLKVCHTSEQKLIALPYQLFQSWIENGRSNRVYSWCILTVETPFEIWATALSGGLFGPSRTCFWKMAILSRLNNHYFEMYQNRCYIAGASSEIQ